MCRLSLICKGEIIIMLLLNVFYNFFIIIFSLVFVIKVQCFVVVTIADKNIYGQYFLLSHHWIF